MSVVSNLTIYLSIWWCFLESIGYWIRCLHSQTVKNAINETICIVCGKLCLVKSKIWGILKMLTTFMMFHNIYMALSIFNYSLIIIIFIALPNWTVMTYAMGWYHILWTTIVFNCVNGLDIINNSLLMWYNFIYNLNFGILWIPVRNVILHWYVTL